MNLKKLFLDHCKKNNLEINPNQLELVGQLNDFYNLNFNKSFLKKIFSTKILNYVNNEFILMNL
jgi:cell division protein ZapE